MAEPLGADFPIGLSTEHDHRVAPLTPPPSLTDEYAASASPEPDGTQRESVGTAIRIKDTNPAAWRRAQLPAANRGTTGGVRLPLQDA